MGTRFSELDASDLWWMIKLDGSDAWDRMDSFIIYRWLKTTWKVGTLLIFSWRNDVESSFFHYKTKTTFNAQLNRNIQKCSAYSRTRVKVGLTNYQIQKVSCKMSEKRSNNTHTCPTKYCLHWLSIHVRLMLSWKCKQNNFYVALETYSCDNNSCL